MKKMYLLLTSIIGLLTLAVYSTYAMFTSSVEVDMVNMDTNINYMFDINGTQELKVSAGSKLRFNATINNSMKGKISYGMYYKIISPNSLPDGIIIAQVSDNLTMLAKGQLESGSSKTVPMVIKNPSDSEITIEIGVRTGYATESQGVDDIIYNSGEIPITSFQTSEEAGNDSCTATMECTTDCSSKQVDGKWMEVCYCYTGNEGKAPGRTSDEMLKYLGLTANNGTPNFDNKATTDEGIYSALDDYGTSYYFRGAVENNYVYFAGYYWRIIRINGDGSIRMIYDGTSAHANGESSKDRQIGTSKFNDSHNDNAYVGYMYGNIGASTYDETHKNINDSTIKTLVDNWYKTNIEDKGYGNKVADTIYCNDRSTSGNNGYGSSNTYYRVSGIGNPILTCQNKNDRFTVNDTDKGNGALTYPVGLITADEINMAGGKDSSSNSSYYLAIGLKIWTMTPRCFDFYAYMWTENSGSSITRAPDFTDSGIGFTSTNSIASVRPVLSLKSDINVTGSGTISNPWVVE